jgi:hypothetical protein
MKKHSVLYYYRYYYLFDIVEEYSVVLFVWIKIEILMNWIRKK